MAYLYRFEENVSLREGVQVLKENISLQEGVQVLKCLLSYLYCFPPLILPV